MCGGGGGGGGGNDWTYQANIDRDIEANRQREVQAQIAAAENEKVGARNRFTSSLAGADPYGRSVATQYLTERGLPVDEGTLNTITQSILNNIPDLDPNPNKYFTRESVGSALDTVAQGTRDRLGNQISSTFAPGFERTLIADTADDPYLEAILGEQRGNASKIVDFNQKRGLLNDVGYQSAVADLDRQGGAARSSLNQIGESVLGKSRQKLSDIRGEAGQAASGYNYGAATPDVGSYYTRAQQQAGADLSGLEGSIRSAVGTTNFFDAPVALQKGGTLQGPINLTTRPAGVMAQAEKKDQGRGLGSTGVF